MLSCETLGAKAKRDDFEALFKSNFQRKIISAKIEKISWQISIAALMQPFKSDFLCPAAKENSITHAAAAPSNLEAITRPSARRWVAKYNRTTCNIVQLRQELQLQSRISTPKQKETILKHFLKAIFKGKSSAPNLRKSRDKSVSQLWCSHLQKTIILRTQPRRQATLAKPLQCDLHRLVSKYNRTTSKSEGKETHDLSVPRRSAETELRNLSRTTHKNVAETTPEQSVPLRSSETELHHNRITRAKEAFARNFLQILTVEDVKTKVSCETFFKFQQLKLWKRSFRA